MLLTNKSFQTPTAAAQNKKENIFATVMWRDIRTCFSSIFVGFFVAACRLDDFLNSNDKLECNGQKCKTETKSERRRSQSWKWKKWFVCTVHSTCACVTLQAEIHTFFYWNYINFKMYVIIILIQEMDEIHKNCIHIYMMWFDDNADEMRFYHAVIFSIQLLRCEKLHKWISN